MMQLRLSDDSAVRIIVSTDKVSRGFDTSHLDGVLDLQPGHNIERVLQSLLRSGRYHRGQRLVVHVAPDTMRNLVRAQRPCILSLDAEWEVTHNTRGEINGTKSVAVIQIG
jgi:superfamily II DNA/RNA helicase